MTKLLVGRGCDSRRLHHNRSKLGTRVQLTERPVMMGATRFDGLGNRKTRRGVISRHRLRPKRLGQQRQMSMRTTTTSRLTRATESSWRPKGFHG